MLPAGQLRMFSSVHNCKREFGHKCTRLRKGPEILLLTSSKKEGLFLKIAKATEMRFSREMLHLSLV